MRPTRTYTGESGFGVTVAVLAIDGTVLDLPDAVFMPRGHGRVQSRQESVMKEKYIAHSRFIPPHSCLDKPTGYCGSFQHQ